MTLLHRLFLPTLFAIALLTAGCSSNNHTDETEPAPEPVAKEQQPAEKEEPNTIGLPKQDIDFSKVQVVDEKRFIEEVCEFDNGRYGFKCKRPIIIDFTAGWCGWCTKLSPHLVDLAQKYSDQIAIYKVDVDKCPNIAQNFRIEGLPTLIIVKPYHQPERIEGYLEKAELEKIIQEKLLSE